MAVKTAAGVAVIGGALALLHLTGVLDLHAERLANGMGLFIPALMLAYFAYQFLFGGFDAAEKKRLAVVLILCALSSVFWGGYEQGGSSLNLFASRATNLNILGFEIPAGWVQSVNPIFLILLAPVAGWLWVRLGSREPSLPAKFAYALVQLAISFFVMAWAGTFVTGTSKVSLLWLISNNFFATTAELCLSPVGLSSMTKLAPRKIVGQMMGIWFLATSLGDLLAGLAAGFTESLGYVQLFSAVGAVALVAGALLGAASGPIRKMMGGVR
jgi:POT family proton-dependent oligopeptide transporter